MNISFTKNKFGIADNTNTASLSIETTFLVNLTLSMVEKISIQFGKHVGGNNNTMYQSLKVFTMNTCRHHQVLPSFSVKHLEKFCQIKYDTITKLLYSLKQYYGKAALQETYIFKLQFLQTN